MDPLYILCRRYMCSVIPQSSCTGRYGVAVTRDYNLNARPLPSLKENQQRLYIRNTSWSFLSSSVPRHPRWTHQSQSQSPWQLGWPCECCLVTTLVPWKQGGADFAAGLLLIAHHPLIEPHGDLRRRANVQGTGKGPVTWLMPYDCQEDCAVSATHRVSSTEFSTMKDVTYSANCYAGNGFKTSRPLENMSEDDGCFLRRVLKSNTLHEIKMNEVY